MISITMNKWRICSLLPPMRAPIVTVTRLACDAGRQYGWITFIDPSRSSALSTRWYYGGRHVDAAVGRDVRVVARVAARW